MTKLKFTKIWELRKYKCHTPNFDQGPPFNHHFMCISKPILFTFYSHFNSHFKLYFNARRINILILKFICIFKALGTCILFLIFFILFIRFWRFYSPSNFVVSDEISAERYFKIPHFWFRRENFNFVYYFYFLF